ncbi:hypothetical protein Pla144_12400 [Bythopirellula polymerisocia]|uniref:Uncharacterized protein n=1 Tax=Bythopirellula polymerisocia TaxID=2528003 RepID=A0A5C6D014_9BACT|nr:hypothetical protein Pla144_12400 [Bythopirellula polymerisocia]
MAHEGLISIEEFTDSMSKLGSIRVREPTCGEEGQS